MKRNIPHISRHYVTVMSDDRSILDIRMTRVKNIFRDEKSTGWEFSSFQKAYIRASHKNPRV